MRTEEKGRREDGTAVRIEEKPGREEQKRKDRKAGHESRIGEQNRRARQ